MFPIVAITPSGKYTQPAEAAACLPDDFLFPMATAASTALEQYTTLMKVENPTAGIWLRTPVFLATYAISLLEEHEARTAGDSVALKSTKSLKHRLATLQYPAARAGDRKGTAAKYPRWWGHPETDAKARTYVSMLTTLPFKVPDPYVEPDDERTLEEALSEDGYDYPFPGRPELQDETWVKPEDWAPSRPVIGDDQIWCNCSGTRWFDDGVNESPWLRCRQCGLGLRPWVASALKDHDHMFVEGSLDGVTITTTEWFSRDTPRARKVRKNESDYRLQSVGSDDDFMDIRPKYIWSWKTEDWRTELRKELKETLADR